MEGLQSTNQWEMRGMARSMACILLAPPEFFKNPEDMVVWKLDQSQGKMPTNKVQSIVKGR